MKEKMEPQEKADHALTQLTQIALYLRARGFVREAAILLFLKSIDLAFNQAPESEHK